MNYFAYPSAAERYAQGRPYFHPLVAGWLDASVRGLFRTELGEFSFSCVLDIFRKQGDN